MPIVVVIDMPLLEPTGSAVGVEQAPAGPTLIGA